MSAAKRETFSGKIKTEEGWVTIGPVLCVGFEESG